MSDFDPEELKTLFKRATPEERLLDRLEQINNFQIRHSTSLDSIQQASERTARWTQGAVNQLANIRSLLWIVIALLGLIAWKLMFA